jgi:hypothetical protein
MPRTASSSAVHVRRERRGTSVGCAMEVFDEAFLEAAGRSSASRREVVGRVGTREVKHTCLRRIMVEAAGVEISRDVNETEHLLHEQELGVLSDLTSSVVIW